MIFKGKRNPDGVVVTVDDVAINPRHDLASNTHGEFEWGYDGAGPTRLALAILAHYYNDDAKALSDHKRFLGGYIAAIQEDRWALDSREIENILQGFVSVSMTLNELLDKVRQG
jgi:hypothetical protein